MSTFHCTFPVAGPAFPYLLLAAAFTEELTDVHGSTGLGAACAVQRRFIAGIIGMPSPLFVVVQCIRAKQCTHAISQLLNSCSAIAVLHICAMLTKMRTAVLSIWLSVMLVECRKLYSQRPTSSLLGMQTIVSVVGIWVLDVCFLVAGFEYMRHQPGYVLWPAQ